MSRFSLSILISRTSEPISASGWIVPSSLLASDTEIRVVLSVILAFKSSRLIRPLGKTFTAVPLYCCATARTESCSVSRYKTSPLP